VIRGAALSGLLLLTLAAGCDRSDRPGEGSAVPGLPACRALRSGIELPAALRESSGVALSRSTPGAVWSHSDARGSPELLALSLEGRLLGTVGVRAVRLEDWEDLALGPCGEATCLHLADIGDNRAARPEIAIYRLPEPPAADARIDHAERFPMRYPGPPRDAEALFLLPDGAAYVVTKGTGSPISLFRYPAPFAPERTVVLEHLRDLSTGPVPMLDRVTGADASPDGRWVAMRTAVDLLLFRTEDLLEGPDPRPYRLSLRALGEPQGEGVALGDQGLVVLTSEGGGRMLPGTMSVLRCTLP
jgi:hypothetical protein